MGTKIEGPIRIGLFDSGIGGLSVLSAIWQLLDRANFFYVADRAFMPYGKLSTQDVIKRAQWCCQYLLDLHQVHLVVVACNTATAAAITDLRKTFPNIPFVGVEPYVNVLNREANLFKPQDRVAVLTTPLLAKSERFKELKMKKDEASRINVLSCPELAQIVEEAFKLEKMSPELLKRVEKELQSVIGFEHLILGCTHYPLIRKSIADVTKAQVFCPNPHIAKRVQTVLNEHYTCADSCGEFVSPNFRFYCTQKQAEESIPLSTLLKWPK